MGKGAVIGQQHKAGAGLVQPPRREQLPPRVGVPHQIHHGGVPLVGGSAHHALGLVEHQVHKLLVIQGFAVHGHSVGFFELGVPFLQTAPFTCTRPLESSALASLRVHWAVSEKDFPGRGKISPKGDKGERLTHEVQLKEFFFPVLFVKSKKEKPAGFSFLQNKL